MRQDRLIPDFDSSTIRPSPNKRLRHPAGCFLSEGSVAMSNYTGDTTHTYLPFVRILT